MEYLIAFAILILIVEFTFKPRLDTTSEGWWLLWYGKKTRNYIRLFKKDIDKYY